MFDEYNRRAKECGSLVIKNGTQRAQLIMSPYAADISSGRC